MTLFAYKYSGRSSSDPREQFFEEMLEELLAWRWDSAGSQESVDAVERKWREKWALQRLESDSP